MKNTSMDMTNGPFFKKIVQFTVPLIFSGLLQIFFNTADVIIVGRFAGKVYLAAVGATSSVTQLLVNAAFGFTIGAGVICAKGIGQKNERKIKNTVHTSMIFGFLLGVFLGTAGFFLSPLVLSLLKTPEAVLLYSVRYLKICFLGFPATMVYNFGCALLRSDGDTKRPLFFLALSGMLNIILNIIFVTVFSLNVTGVAIATVISQYLSAFLVIRELIKKDNYLKLEKENLKINKRELGEICYIGLPSGIQSSFFAVSIMVLQSGINSFGETFVAGNTAAATLENLVYVFIASVANSVTAFLSQNVGANKWENVKRLVKLFLLFIFITDFGSAIIIVLLRNRIGLLFTSDAEVIKILSKRILYVLPFQFVLGFQDVFAAALKTFGRVIEGVVAALISVCAFRIIWIMTVFKAYHTEEILYLSFPLSWFLSFAAMGILYAIYKAKAEKKSL